VPCIFAKNANSDSSLTRACGFRGLRTGVPIDCGH
jgi:hypothetical protein